MRTFRHFNRQGYALFAALGHEVRIGVLAAATLASAAPRLSLRAAVVTPAEADSAVAGPSADDEARTLAEAVVAGSRAPLAAGLAARQVTTLGRRELAAAGVESINDVLKLAAGVDVRQRGGFGVQTDISIDGGTFDQIAILVNGVAINNAQTGHNAADFPLNIDDIERIEILEGAASRLYGSQAFSGAINVVTRQGGSPLELTAAGGSYGTWKAAARSALSPSPRMHTSVSAGYRRSDGAVSNGDFEGVKAFWQGRYEDEALRADAQAGVTATDFGANTFYSGAFPNQWEALRRYLLSARAETKGRVHLSGQLSWLRNVDHYQLVRGTDRGENFNRGDVFTASVGLWTAWRLGRTAAGAELREEGLYSTNLGRELPEHLHFPVRGADGVNYTRRDARTNVSYYVEHNIVLRRVTVSAGLIGESNTAARRGFRFYPGLDLSYRPAERWRLYASWNTALRLPTFTDLWYKTPAQEGNAGLSPERCWSLRAGADYNGRVVQARAKAHFSRGRDMIDWVMYAPDDIYHATSFSLDNAGLALSATANLGEWLGKGQPLRRLTADYAWLHQHRRKGEDFFKSNYALEYLRHKFTATLTHTLFSRLGATWTLRVQQRRGAYLTYENGTATGRLRPYGTHALLDCRLTWSAPRYELFADLSNLTARRYYDLGNVRQPGFLVMAGAKFRL